MGRKGDRKPRRLHGDSSDPQGLVALGNRFLEALQIRNFSNHTIHHHHRCLRGFIHWASDRSITRPSEVTRPILERFQRWLFHYRKKDGDPLSVSTQQGYVITLRAWYKWLARQNHVLYNPASDLELPRRSKTLPRNILTASEAELVLKQPKIHHPIGLRDRAILETFYSTGMRRMELSNLTLYDVCRERGTVLIRQGKGKKDRLIPIGERALLWIEKYVQEARPQLLVSGKSTDILFLSHFGEAMAEERLSQLVQEYITSADIGKQGSCHVWRHTCATLMLENGCDIRFIQLLLGHANLTTTQIYTQVSIQKLIEMHRATHPAKLEPSSPDTPGIE